MRLNGKIAIITGGASGIGAASARRFVAEGARVAIADLNLEAAQAIARELGEHCMAMRCDHASIDDDRALVAAVVERWGGLDILYNNAAGTGKTSFEDCSEEQFDRMLHSTLIGPWRLTKAALPALKESAAKSPGIGSAIVFTGSRQSAFGAVANSPYVVFKHGIMGMVRSLAADLGPSNIRVNAVCPGIVPTPRVMTDTPWGKPEDVIARYLTRTPLQRITQPQDIAATALFLVSDDARAISGQAVFVDGGMSAV